MTSPLKSLAEKESYEELNSSQDKRIVVGVEEDLKMGCVSVVDFAV